MNPVQFQSFFKKCLLDNIIAENAQKGVFCLVDTSSPPKLKFFFDKNRWSGLLGQETGIHKWEVALD
jgi:hypothetical protein